MEASLGENYWPVVWTVAKEVFIALALIVASFCALQFTVLKLPMAKLVQVGVGICYTFIGLVIFLTAVTVGFMPIGFEIGCELAKRPHALVTAGFIIGMVVVLAEPAVHVLNKQVYELTTGAEAFHAHCAFGGCRYFDWTFDAPHYCRLPDYLLPVARLLYFAWTFVLCAETLYGDCF